LNTAASQKPVGYLEVAVDDPLAVDVPDTGNQLVKDPPRLVALADWLVGKGKGLLS
jgi:hypothetical protein